MPLHQRGNHRYGDNHVDIHAEILRYSELNGYVAEHFAYAVCIFGGKSFALWLDDNEGAAVRSCSSCDATHPLGDSDAFPRRRRAGNVRLPLRRRGVRNRRRPRAL